MLRNYLKIALAVLLRRRFLTFVNLFGAALTLTVLVVAFAIFDSFVSPAGAQHRQNQIVSIVRILLTGPNSELVGGPGYKFYEGYAAPLETPDKVSFATTPNPTISYLDGRKVTSQLRRTDAPYWEILDFDVLDGRVLQTDDIDQGRFVAVINETTANTYFPGESAIGKKITAGGDSYEVVGVVADEAEISRLAYSDIWVPLTTSQTYRDQWILGGQIMLYVDDPSQRAAVQNEFKQALEGFVAADDPHRFDRAVSVAWTPLGMLASFIIGNMSSGFDDKFADDRVPQFLALAGAITLLFMALPAINMANLNIGRMLERAPEIGLRKATGASRLALTGQFIFENVVLCALGGLLAFAIAPLVLAYLNATLFTYGRLTLSAPVFVAGFIFILIFGVLSGAYPAWKMARLEPAAALRGLQHA
ncbi:MAG TPA: ABC transporter permease [Povalibacter sp.]|uniref:ABC transporter permease n=1 Tax=Povalibacter sp. TaxID=1962978 RepID=UPI002CF7806B|nr:ABC transporter permease [Povalibacter sp.]HMN47280.1 ABC transporter permease [Povalibacter sp.]